MHFAELSSSNTNQTELIALLIIQGRTFTEGIENVFKHIKGSCSMLILTEDGSVIAARDKWGRTPVVIGKKEDAYAATSESSSFPNLDYEIERYLGPGEIVRMYADRIEQLRQPNEEMQICSFLWVYYGFPTSCYEGKNVEEVRFTSGMKMGQKDESEVDCVCGIPDSGVGMALGYAEGKGVPYHRAISKYTPTWPRSFTPSNQEMRSLVAKMKLIPNRAMLQGKRLLFCDDSIVRGTQLRDNVKILYDYGAKEVHMRIACPPLIYACPFVGFNVVISMYFAASEHARPAHIISLLRGFIIIIPAAYLFSGVAGITGVWCAFPATEAIVALLSMLFYVLIRKRTAREGRIS